MVTKDNFHIHTNVTWQRLKYGDQAHDLFELLEATCEVIRPMGSTSIYLVNEKEGIVYRYADHWGRVASCFWALDNPLQPWHHPRERVLAKASFSSFIQKTPSSCQL